MSALPGTAWPAHSCRRNNTSSYKWAVHCPSLLHSSHPLHLKPQHTIKSLASNTQSQRSRHSNIFHSYLGRLFECGVIQPMNELENKTKDVTDLPPWQEQTSLMIPVSRNYLRRCIQAPSKTDFCGISCPRAPEFHPTTCKRQDGTLLHT